MCVLYHCNALYKPVEYTEGSKITCSQALQAITNRTANLSHSRFSPIICSAPICHTVSSPLSLLLRQSVMQQTFACRTYHANLSCSRLLPIISWLPIIPTTPICHIVSLWLSFLSCQSVTQPDAATPTCHTANLAYHAIILSAPICHIVSLWLERDFCDLRFLSMSFSSTNLIGKPLTRIDTYESRAYYCTNCL